jgi:hypothetical protein
MKKLYDRPGGDGVAFDCRQTAMPADGMSSAEF